MMSTKHIGELTDYGKKDLRSKKNIFESDVILEYNKTMGGVDTLSRVLNPYSIQRKGIKWYRKLWELFVDIAVYNSFVVWCKLNYSDITHLTFRQNLMKEITSFHLYGHQQRQTGAHQHDNSMRLLEHHFIRKIPQHQGGKRVRRKCVRCNMLGKRVDTMYFCPKCDVGLCVDVCFEVYHTRRNITDYLDGQMDPNISVVSSIMDFTSTSIMESTVLSEINDSQLLEV